MKTFIPNLVQVKKSSGSGGLDAATENLYVNSYSRLGNPMAMLTGKLSGLGSSISPISEVSGIPMEPHASGALLMAVTGVLIILRRRRACRGV